jgi:hypothetical protein
MQITARKKMRKPVLPTLGADVVPERMIPAGPGPVNGSGKSAVIAARPAPPACLDGSGRVESLAW